MSQNFINSHIMENEHECWVVIADIDHFKKINDTYGHATGDKVLHLLARRFKENLRKSAEFIGRIGGEEFALFLLDSCEKNTRGLTERLWRVCSEQPYVMEDGSKIHMTCSFGIAKVNDVEGKSAEEVLKEAMKNADAALYQAKHEGRNRIVLYCVS